MVLRLRAILFLLILSLFHSFGHADEVPQEYLVKAKYLLNVPLFTEMLSQTRDSSFSICLIGDTPLESALASSKGKLIKNRPLVIRKVEELSGGDSCQMLFIASSERHRLQPLLSEAHRQGILTISDMRDFARMGGIIGLLTVDNRVTLT